MDLFQRPARSVWWRYNARALSQGPGESEQGET